MISVFYVLSPQLENFNTIILPNEDTILACIAEDLYKRLKFKCDQMKIDQPDFNSILFLVDEIEGRTIPYYDWKKQNILFSSVKDLKIINNEKKYFMINTSESKRYPRIVCKVKITNPTNQKNYDGEALIDTGCCDQLIVNEEVSKILNLTKFKGIISEGISGKAITFSSAEVLTTEIKDHRNIKVSMPMTCQVYSGAIPVILGLLGLELFNLNVDIIEKKTYYKDLSLNEKK